MAKGEHLSNLNEAQKKAATVLSGPLLILAGAGAGKTKTITHRIIHLMENNIPGDSILAITFTNKAAKEMRERIHGAVVNEKLGTSLPFVSTFHALCVYILREQFRHIGMTKFFTILDSDDTKTLVKDAIKSIGLDPKQFEPRRFRSIISKEKNDFVTVEEYRDRAKNNVEKMAARVWALYEVMKKKENAFDFDDLLLEVVKLFKRNPEVLSHYQEKWKYIHIDEYQDTNEVQYQLAKMLAERYKNICVVGDGDQNIYGWRGANIKNILNFEEDYPDSNSVLLEQNYRSTQTILDAANEIIKKNTLRKDKNLFTQNHAGEKIVLFEGYDENEEAGFIAETIYGLLEQGTSPKEIAVLYRANFQSRVLEEAMLMKSIPYQVLGVKFFERKEIKDVLSYVRVALNRECLSDLKRVINFPTRGIGKTSVLKLFAGGIGDLPAAMQRKILSFYEVLDEIKNFSETHEPSETIKHIITATGIEKELKEGTDDDLERLENMKELVTLALRYDTIEDGLQRLLEDAVLASEQDSIDEKKDRDAVRLMTVHASKGLEFAHVFVAGLEQDLFPHKKDDNASEEAQEEERRLFYVALTRAKERLYITHSNIRTIFGSRQVNMPSEFLYDIPEHLVTREYPRNIKTIYLD